MATKTVKATCLVTLQVNCDCAWSEDTIMKQIIQQAEADAKGRIERLFKDASTDDANLACKRSGSYNVSFVSVNQITTQVVVDR